MTSDRNALLLLAFVIFPLALVYARSVYAPCDDAYIALVYVKNFLAGNGVTFQGVRVEGFTSPLWIALLSLLGLTQLPLPALAEGLSLVCGLFALWTTYLLGRGLGLPPYSALLPCALVAATGDVVFYMGSGLEQVLFMGTVALCAGQVVREDPAATLRSIRFPLLLALMILTRPEGALVAGCFLVWLWVLSGSLGLVLRCGLVLCAMLAPVLLAKRLYFGYWLPNTYYAKSGAGLANLGRGIEYLREAAVRYAPALIALLSCAAVNGWAGAKELNRRALPLLGLALVWLLYVGLQGGDNMVGGRMVIPVLPLVYAAMVLLVSSWPLPRMAIATLALLPLLIWMDHQDAGVQRERRSWTRAFPGRAAIGHYLREHYPSDTLVALNPAGVIPFYSGLPTIDMLGLNDEYIAHHGKRDRSRRFAHQAGDGEYVLSRKPGVIVFGSSGRAKAKEQISEREIWANEDFHRDYKPVELPSGAVLFVRGN